MSILSATSNISIFWKRSMWREKDMKLDTDKDIVNQLSLMVQ